MLVGYKDHMYTLKKLMLIIVIFYCIFIFKVIFLKNIIIFFLKNNLFKYKKFLNLIKKTFTSTSYSY